MRWWLAFVVLLAACRTATPPLPTPPSAWELPLELVDGVPTVNGLTLDTTATATTTTRGAPFDLGGAHVTPRRGPQNVLALGSLPPASAVVLDFPRRRVLGLDASTAGWLRWLDARSPKGKLESLPRVAPMTVKSDVGDRRGVFTQLTSTVRRSQFPAVMFDAALVHDGQVSGLHLQLGETTFGPLDVDARDDLTASARLGMDVLQNVVLLLPNDPNQGVWLLVPRE